MSVTQYIGARYVPIFADPIEWNDTRQYEPLTIVQYKGASYTSKQAVPLGIPITDTAFWALTGNYNAQVEQYRQEVRTFDGRITEAQEIAEEAQDGLEAEIQNRIAADVALSEAIAAEAQAREEAIQAEAQARAASEEALENSILSTAELRFKHKKIVCIGDSFTKGNQTTNYWPHFVNTVYGATTYNFGKPGQGFVNNAGGVFYDQLTAAINSSEFDNEDITDVIIIGGYNDYAASGSDLDNAVASIVRDAKSAFTNATIYMGAMLCGVYPLNYAIGGATNDQYRSRYISRMEYQAKSNGAIILPRPWTWLKGEMSWAVDNVHVNDAGQKYIAECIVNSMLGVNPTPFKQTRITSSDSAAIEEIDIMITAVDGMVDVDGHIKLKTDTAGALLFTALPEFAYFSQGFNAYHLVPNSSDKDNPSFVVTNGTTLRAFKTIANENIWFKGTWPQGI